MIPESAPPVKSNGENVPDNAISRVIASVKNWRESLQETHKQVELGHVRDHVPTDQEAKTLAILMAKDMGKNLTPFTQALIEQASKQNSEAAKTLLETSLKSFGQYVNEQKSPATVSMSSHYLQKILQENLSPEISDTLSRNLGSKNNSSGWGYSK